MSDAKREGKAGKKDSSIWGDLARMEAEVVDPEERATEHYNYVALKEKLRQIDPSAAEVIDRAPVSTKRTRESVAGDDEPPSSLAGVLDDALTDAAHDDGSPQVEVSVLSEHADLLYDESDEVEVGDEEDEEDEDEPTKVARDYGNLVRPRTLNDGDEDEPTRVARTIPHDEDDDHDHHRVEDTDDDAALSRAAEMARLRRNDILLWLLAAALFLVGTSVWVAYR